MELRWGITWLLVASSTALVMSLPTSLLEDAKSVEARFDNKVKRAQDTLQRSAEEKPRASVAYFGNPSAKKRGTNLKNENAEQLVNEWEQERALFRNPPELDQNLYELDDNLYSGGDEKTIAEYEKGFNYGTNKAKLDEEMENAVLKSEIYGDPVISQYRYYGGAEERRRRKRSEAKKRLIKRDVDLSPEDVLTLLTIWENDHRMPPNGYRTSWQRQNNEVDLDGDRDENDIEEDDEGWLEGPVYPGATYSKSYLPNYYYEDSKEYPEKRGRWGGFSDMKKKKKRFMVAKKRSDPTRELRYLNGPAQRNDFYTLSQLLSSQPDRDPNVPLYHRVVL